MALGTGQQQQLMEERILDLTEQEGRLIKLIISYLPNLMSLNIREMALDEELKRFKEKDQDTVNRLTKILEIDSSAIRELCLIIGLNTTISLATDKTKIKFNNLQLFELRKILIKNLKNKSNASYREVLESILDKVQKTLTWDIIGEIDILYKSIEITLYRNVVTKSISDATMSQ